MHLLGIAEEGRMAGNGELCPPKLKKPVKENLQLYLIT
jgi:hypothetical protein